MQGFKVTAKHLQQKTWNAFLLHLIIAELGVPNQEVEEAPEKESFG